MTIKPIIGDIRAALQALLASTAPPRPLDYTGRHLTFYGTPEKKRGRAA